jgi:hypothetical protein
MSTKKSRDKNFIGRIEIELLELGSNPHRALICSETIHEERQKLGTFPELPNVVKIWECPS